MLSIQINDIKKLTALLFTGDAFDKFLLHDARFMTSVETEINGTLNPKFYPEEEQEAIRKQGYISWKDMRDVCFRLIKGQRLPLFFHVVLLTPEETTAWLVRKCNFDECPISSFSMNLIYRDNVLNLTAGVSFAGFTLDKEPEKIWSKTILNFLDEKGITYEEV